MIKRKKIINSMSVLLILFALIVFSFFYEHRRILENNIPMSGSASIEEDKADISVIPDKYNTGAKEPASGYIAVEPNTTHEGVLFKNGSSDKLTLDFAYSNKAISGTVTFNNYDFRKKGLHLVNEESVNRDIKIVFNNCVFGQFSNTRVETRIKFEFNNCSFGNVKGSNLTLNRCRLGGTYSDAVFPYCNFIIKDSYICDLSYPLDSGTLHTDGVQIAGYNGADAYNIHFENCRFEIPQLSYSSNNSYINACLMLALEKSNGDDISFKNCYINGGGYSIYACVRPELTISNAVFEDIRIGCTKKYGNVRWPIADGVKMTNVKDTDALYVSTVDRDRESNTTSICVTNDTNQERRFVVYTDSGKSYEFDMEACPLFKEIGDRKFEDFPFDVMYEIPEYADWVVVYEVAENGDKEQYTRIRYKNWTDEEIKETVDTNTGKVVLSTKKMDESNDVEKVPEIDMEGVVEDSAINGADSVEDDSDIVLEGKCGNKVDFELTSDGNLKLDGSGATYNYNSKNPSPWFESKDEIKTIEIGKGITTLGNQLFLRCTKIKELEIPDGVTKIGSNVFLGCKNLEYISIPASIVEIGQYAFWNVSLKEVKYEGTNENRKNIVIGGSNDNLIVSLTELKDEVIEEGSCGSNIKWTLTESGVLSLNGIGETYSYSSKKPAPWGEYKSNISEVVISDGITGLGNQLFLNCSKIKGITIGKDVKKIGGNVFMNCSAFTSINFPNALKTVGEYSFKNTSIKEVNYDGTKEEWENVSIGGNNKPLMDADIITN